MAENLICKSCKKFVHERQNAIFCDSCKTWLHLKCTGLPKSQFYDIGENDDPWFCKHCYCEIFPFHTLDKKISNFVAAFSYVPIFNDTDIDNLASYHAFCSICQRKNKQIKKGIPCNQCRCKIHKKCCNLGQYYMLNKKNTLKTWNCFICQKDNFPFMDTDDIDFLEGSFKSNFDCVCQNQNKIEKDDNYDILEKLELCELNSSHHQLNNELDIDENLTLKNNFKYHTTHDFHKLLKRKEISNIGNCFSVLHTNISSLQCNFSKLELLLYKSGSQL